MSHALETSLRGCIIDYVRLRFWPAFNLADVAITVGAAGPSRADGHHDEGGLMLSPRLPLAEAVPSFPRYFKIGRHWVSAYKVFLCMGIYTGTLVSAAVAQGSGISPLRMGVGCVSCAILGMVGARLFYLLVFARSIRRTLLGRGVELCRAHADDVPVECHFECFPPSMPWNIRTRV